MNILIYQNKKNFDVQKAERFFKERRIPFQTVDLKKHAPGKKELALFARRLGAQNLLDRKNPAVLSHPAAYTDDEEYILETLLEQPAFLRTPIVRNGEQVTLGADEGAWASWLNQ